MLNKIKETHELIRPSLSTMTVIHASLVNFTSLNVRILVDIDRPLRLPIWNSYMFGVEDSVRMACHD